MAEKRMFSKMIVDSDAFLEMPLSTQALYFHLEYLCGHLRIVQMVKKMKPFIKQEQYGLMFKNSETTIRPDYLGQK